jgi:hypothetical protein
MPNFCFCRFEMTTNEELEACKNRRISVESTDRNLFMPLSEAVLTLHRLPQIHSQYISVEFSCTEVSPNGTKKVHNMRKVSIMPVSKL